MKICVGGFFLLWSDRIEIKKLILMVCCVRLKVLLFYAMCVCIFVIKKINLRFFFFLYTILEKGYETENTIPNSNDNKFAIINKKKNGDPIRLLIKTTCVDHLNNQILSIKSNVFLYIWLNILIATILLNRANKNACLKFLFIYQHFIETESDDIL